MAKSQKLKSVGRDSYFPIKKRLKQLEVDSRAISSEQHALDMEVLRLREHIIRFEQVFSEGPWKMGIATATGEIWLMALVRDFPTLDKDPVFTDRHGFGLGMIELCSNVRLHEHDGEITIQGAAKEILKVIRAYHIQVDASAHKEQAVKLRETADIIDGLVASVEASQERAKAKCASKPKKRPRSRSTRTKSARR